MHGKLPMNSMRAVLSLCNRRTRPMKPLAVSRLAAARWPKGSTKSWSKTPNTHTQSYEADSVEQGLLISAVQAG